MTIGRQHSRGRKIARDVFILSWVRFAHTLNRFKRGNGRVLPPVGQKFDRTQLKRRCVFCLKLIYLRAQPVVRKLVIIALFGGFTDKLVAVQTPGLV